ncbi:probable G-protein coupled receptor Mth-like 11 isoform X1 [Drosophila miranda]|uniref:probable G-protein coupled receptor Mth-like 11 isoform X1 n=2 Tax=Drosophila miranda TaxID=7229 RepID=UPI00143FA020|nr:probable G-protein coupled receptor Mth-like 11 isoform X1 [Drosophila miranda]
MHVAPFWSTFLGLFAGSIAADIPDCNFFDTVNLTNSWKFPNGSYSYRGLIIPPSLTGEYDYEIQFDGASRSVASHTRGCVCRVKPCIRFCCPLSKVMQYNRCSPQSQNKYAYNMTLDITQDNGTVTSKHVVEDFVVQEDLPLPCSNHYALNRHKYTTDLWTLYENGTLFRQYDKIYLSKQDYCLQPRRSREQIGYNYTIVPYNCSIDPDRTMAYVKAISVLFMAITIAVYLWLPQFQSLHGKCCNLYFICLTATFLLNVFSIFNVFESKMACSINGYAGYFATMATFLWLSVICFDAWSRIVMRRSQGLQEAGRRSFLNYNLIVWSIAGALTLVVFLVDRLVPYSSKLDKTLTLVPAVGVFSCWILAQGWSGMLYFYSPLAILLSFNLTIFSVTTRHIYVLDKISSKKLNGIEQKQMSKNRANYGVYLHLFIIMGGSWVLEIVAFICETQKVCKPLIVAADIIKCSQGIIIFLVTFCNRDMIRAIRERTHERRLSGVESATCSLTQDFQLKQDMK